MVEGTSYTGSIVDYFIRPLWPDPYGHLRIRVQSTPPQVVATGDEVLVSFSPDDCVILEENSEQPGSTE